MIPLPLLALVVGGAAVALSMNASASATPAPTPSPEPSPTPEPTPEPEMRTEDYVAFLADYAATPYHDEILAAEQKFRLPENLLARVLWTESRFNPQAISPVGAKGIAQFMDETAQEYDVDPFDASASIVAAARYLRWLRRQVDNWSEALAAYNWGIGNIERRGIEAAPAETVAYYQAIIADSEADE